jgi:hypothetical protein
MDTQVFKSFIFDLLTSIVTAGATWLTVSANVEKIGFEGYLVPVIVGLAGAVVMGLRRFNIVKKQ